MSNLTFRLLERHQKLDAALRLAQTRRWVDPFEIARLKKLKLMVKDRLSRLARRPRAKASLSTGG
ncbi:YdcH family protein [Novosphingobium olei]|uniref:YdcH family protein n=1 Tax=Novosphingobium olei TaxID=2728851 RepID=UPI0030899AFA|nr:YdcH family protein [Novosphingobium olei]